MSILFLGIECNLLPGVGARIAWPQDVDKILIEDGLGHSVGSGVDCLWFDHREVPGEVNGLVGLKRVASCLIRFRPGQRHLILGVSYLYRLH